MTNSLVMIDFPLETIALTPCFMEQEVLSSIEKTAKEHCSLPKVSRAYGPLVFPKAPHDRPYTYSSIVLSSDGKMAFSDNPAGPVIAKNNYVDTDGALTDFWVLNALRSYSDAVILGAKTLQTEKYNTSHIFDPELLQERLTNLQPKTKHPVSIVVSFDATDIPLDHLIFSIDPKESYPVAIATSPEGSSYLTKHMKRPVRVIDQDIMATEGYDIFSTEKSLPIFVTGEQKSPDALQLLALLKNLGMDRVLIESPSYTAHLMQREALDEFFINYSMVFAGGPITPNSTSPFSSTKHPHAHLIMLNMHRTSFLYTRQLLNYNVKPMDELEKLAY